jgi:putative membrane protein
MTKAMLKTLKTACIITTITGIAALSARADDTKTTTTTTTGTAGYGTTTQSTSGDHSAKSFIKQAFRDNQMEIDMAAVGASKAQNAELKSFCQQLQQDHTKANQELQPIAQRYGVAEEQSKLREHAVNKFDKETAGPEFDKKFATEMLRDHQKDINKFEKAAAKLQEADVKQYAENMLPKLREHLQKAETVARSVGVEQSTISSIMSKTSAVGGTTETETSTTGTGTSGKTIQGSGAQQLQNDTTTTPKDTTTPPKR